jgi:hypothetical protein
MNERETRHRSSHNSEDGELIIYADHGPRMPGAQGFRGATLFCRAEPAFIGADGIRLVYAINDAIREAERIAYRAGQREMRAEIEIAMETLEARKL